jgi:hypothetical protein
MKLDRIGWLAGVLTVCLGLGWPMAAMAAKSTTATSSGNWTDGIWNAGAPDEGDDVTIDSGVTVTLSSTPAYGLNSFTANGTLVFTNWDTSLSAATVTIGATGSATLPPAFTDSQMSNRVYFICTDFTLASGGSINVNGKGWAGGLGTPSPTAGSGPGRGGVAYGGGGASYVGLGQSGGDALGIPGPIYGVKEAPLDPGSGGGGDSASATPGGAGGGAVRIEASGTVSVNGPINANGNIGGGSGGSIFITCRIFAGTGGVLSADGANGTYWGGAGSGGRIAVICDEAAQNAAVRPTVAIRTKVATGCINWARNLPCSIGTIYLNADHAVPDLWASDAKLSGFTSFTPVTLTVTNGYVIFETPISIAVTNDIRIVTGSRVDLTTPVISAGGNIYLSNSTLYAYRGTNLGIRPFLTAGNDLTLNSGSLYLYAGTTNTGAGTNYDVLVTVGRNLDFQTINSWIYPASDPTNGGNVRFAVSNLYISTTNSGFNADYRGYGSGGGVMNGFGPGGGLLNGSAESGGGGHGGRGGEAEVLGKSGAVNDSKTAPIEAGSGSGGAAGGGVIRIEAAGSVLVNGTLSARGALGAAPQHGGGAGGTVNIMCQTFASTNGIVNAAAGSSPGYGGGGGGGRIAIVCNAAQQAMPRPTVAINCAGGIGNAPNRMGAVGTVYINQERALPEVWAGAVSLSGFASYAPTSLTVTNAQVIFEERPAIRVTNDFNVVGGGRLEIVDPDMTVGGSMLFNNATGFLYRATNNLTVRPSVTVGGWLRIQEAGLYVYAATTNNGPGTNYDVSVTAGDTIYMGSNGWICPWSDGTNGGAVLFSAKHVNIAATNSGFQADGLGYAGGPANASTNGFGPGGGVSAGIAGGGGYGGAGGKGAWGGNGGSAYGVLEAPVLPGSGGGGCSGGTSVRGGAGGGLIWIEAPKGTVTVNGKLAANAGATPAGYGPGGGSGGGIYVRCKNLAGEATGSLSANGKQSSTWGGPGGGGRIAVWAVTTNGWQGSVTANGVTAATYEGSRTDGAIGTIYWGQLKAVGTVMVIR